MKKAGLSFAFFLAVVVIGLALHPAIVHIVRAVNEGTAAGCEPSGPTWEGWCWTSPYTRFIPISYEPGASLALDIGISGLFVVGTFLLIARRRRSY